MKPDTLGVVGLGPMGGSIAWQASRSGIRRVIAYSQLPKDGVAAVKVGAVTEISIDVGRVFEQSDLIILALPPYESLELLKRFAPVIADRGSYCTDVASVKERVIRLADDLNLGPHFAGSHPFVEVRGTGFGDARPDILSESLVFITPVKGGDHAAAEIADFWKRVIGAAPVVIDSTSHDATLAWTRHMPQLVASALAATLAKRGPKGVTYGRDALSATKPAANRPDFFTESLMLNKGEVLSALDEVLGEISRLYVDIEAEDAKHIFRRLNAGRKWREMMGD